MYQSRRVKTDNEKREKACRDLGGESVMHNQFKVLILVLIRTKPDYFLFFNYCLNESEDFEIVK